MVYFPQFLVSTLALLGLWTLPPTQDCGAGEICPRICSLHRSIYIRESRHKTLYTFLNAPAEAILAADADEKPAVVAETINRAYEQTLASKYKRELGMTQACIEARQPLQKGERPRDQVQLKTQQLPEACASVEYNIADAALQLPIDVRHYLSDDWWRSKYNSWAREEFSKMDQAEREARDVKPSVERQRANQKRRDEQSSLVHERLMEMCNWPN